MKQLLKSLLTVGLIAAAMAAPAAAQRPHGEQREPRENAKQPQATVPADARPPKGMCRIWVDDVPAAQQPAATDCPTAVRNRPSNGRVVFGDDYADSSQARPAARTRLPHDVKGFTGVQPPPKTLPEHPTHPKRPPR